MIYKNILSGIFYTSIVLALLSLCLVVFFGLSTLLYGFSPGAIGFFIILPLIFACLFLLAIKGYAVQVSLGKKIIKPVRIQRVIYSCVIVVAWILTGFISWAAFGMITDEPPQFFPFDDPKGKYIIVRVPQSMNTSCEEKILNQYPPRTDSKQFYLLDYYGEHVFEGLGSTNCLRVIIAESEESLEQYVNKPVTIKGKFISSDTQCVARKCIDIGGPIISVRIDEVSVK